MSEKKSIYIDAYTKGMVLKLLKWLRKDDVGNTIFNEEAATEQDLIDKFVENSKNNVSTQHYPLGYSILNNTEN